MASYFSKDFKSELTPGKITAKILVALIVTLLAFSYDRISVLVLKIYKHTSQTLYNNLLESVAHGPKDYSLALADFVFTTMILLLLYVSFLMKIRLSKALSDSEVQSDSNKLIDPKKRIKILKRMRVALYFQLGLLLLLLLASTVTFALERSKFDIRRAFERKINIISPYIEAKQKEKLISDFALMKKEEDFNKINSSLDSLFKSNHIIP